GLQETRGNTPLQVRLDLARQRRRLVAVERDVHPGLSCQAILAGFSKSSRANWPDRLRPIRAGRLRRRGPVTMAPQSPRIRGRTRMDGEAPIKQAVKWIDYQLHDNPALNRLKLVDEASRRFDLSPLDAEFLLRHLAER